jgi:hypothetical protein
MESDSYDKRTEQGVLEAVRQQNLSPQPQNSKSSLHVMPAFDDILKGKALQAHPPVVGAGEKEFISQMVEKISHPQQQDRSGEMPSLDLGQQILAQQRKVAALKRKSPGQEIKPQPAQIKSMPEAPPSPHQLIITDIVAKEIMVLASAR